MKLLIVGFGKMGRLIKEKAVEQGHEIAGIIRSSNTNELDERWRNKVDCAIEFTNPDVVTSNLLKCLKLNIPIVTGTTGWETRSVEVFNVFNKNKGTLFHASNFSIGANIFFKVNTYLAKIMSAQNQYKLQIKEIHHLQKLDSPSGTAITLANSIIDNSNKKQWANTDSMDSDTISILSKREENVPGTHIIQYDSLIDQISLEHIAHSREGFAQGALLAAAFIQSKIGIYTMNDIV